ncbi:NADH dehydrogenase [ubiquinone] 1 alpha subcomplex assembly factor 2 [Spea bombifrons]|uniref:NADH dehydrogenase [ubiquinone] 1 alpha subcomplex assembly factor 2 n=1 Tax=Spea bombifrons TaxID=233779 RepID=UPI002349A168|nr:NADH dehydrogenase [ubiquinone] 1 alpha subcomplex assembly factor 2 [Spea bombifrons]
MDKLRALLQRTVRQYMGADQFGNKYYYVPEQKTWTGQKTRAKRIIESVNKKEFEYELGHIPTEWEAWIRGKRKDPPTIEEILRNEKLREDVKTKANEVAEKEQMQQSQENKDGDLIPPQKTQIKGHASASLFGRQKPSEEPASTGNTFQPGSWSPTQKK